MQLVLDRLSFTYHSHSTDRWALRDLSLTIKSGDFWGIIGHSGSGKSTLLQLLAGLIQPSSGTLCLDGESLQSPKLRSKLFARIGIAFQYPEQQLFAPTVGEDIGFAARNAGLSATDCDQRVRQAMAKLNLDYQRYATRSPFELSGGEQRRVALAGILVLQPELLILDEPTAGLDPAGREHLMDVIHDLHSGGCSVVMASHSMEDIAKLANRVLVLVEGRPFLQGSPAEVFRHADELRTHNLGVPDSESFAAELRGLGLPLPPSLLTLNALADALAELLSEQKQSEKNI